VPRSSLEMDLDLFSPTAPANASTPDIAASLGITGTDLFSPHSAAVALSEQAKQIIARMPDLSFMVPAM
jgi:hypothetical protein